MTKYVSFDINNKHTFVVFSDGWQHKQIQGILKDIFGDSVTISDPKGAGYANLTKQGFKPFSNSMGLRIGPHELDYEVMKDAAASDMAFILIGGINSFVLEKWVVDEVIAANANIEKLYGYIKALKHDDDREIPPDSESIQPVHFPDSSWMFDKYCRRSVADVFNCNYF